MLARKSHMVRLRLASNIELADLRNADAAYRGGHQPVTMEMQQAEIPV